MFVVLTRETYTRVYVVNLKGSVCTRVSVYNPSTVLRGIRERRFEFRASPTSLANEKKVARVLPWVQGVANNFRRVVPGQDRCRRIKCIRADFNQVSSVERENYSRDTVLPCASFKYSISFAFTLLLPRLFGRKREREIERGEREREKTIPRARFALRSLAATKHIRTRIQRARG